MFGFKKNIETKIEPGFTEHHDEPPAPPQSLADILGAKENDTNITAGVDAILDDTADISEEAETVGSDKVDFSLLNNAEEPVDLDSYDDSSVGESSAYGELPEYLRGGSSEPFANQEIDSITDSVSSVQNNNEAAAYQPQEQYTETAVDMSQASYPAEEQVLTDEKNTDNEDITSGIDDITVPDGVTAVDDILAAEDNADLSLDDILDSPSSYSVDDILQDNAVEKRNEVGFEEITEESQASEPAAEDFALPEVTSVFAEEPGTEAMPAEESQEPESAAEDFALPEVTSVFADEPGTEAMPAEESQEPESAAEDFALPEVTSVFADEPGTEAMPAEESQESEPAAEDFALPEVTSVFADEPGTEAMPAEESQEPESVTAISALNMPSVSEDIHIKASKVSWRVVDLSGLSESPRVINRNSGFVTWSGDKYQRDIRVDIETFEEAGKWTLTLMNEFSVPLADVNSEVIIEKDPAVVRYAGLIHNGEEKLKIFNQSSYKFITPQDDFFTVQGNVICGRVDSSFSLNITDYREIPLADKLNRYIRFPDLSSGFITGPDGVRVFFANAAGIGLACASELPEPEVFEYIPSLKDFDNKSFFVFDEESETKEFIANGKKKNLVVNTGASLYGWNVRFDNETYMSLRDALEYQTKYKQLPAPNGEIIHGSRILKFFGIETLKARVKVVYYSYGRI